MKIAFFMANGSEETEVIAPIDVLRRANIETHLISIEDTKEISSSHQIKIMADFLFKEISVVDYDVLVFAGGFQGVKTMLKNKLLIEIIADFNKKGKILAAICAAPLLFKEAKVISGKKVVCYPDFYEKMGILEENLPNICYDANLITGKSVAYSLDFGLKIVEVLLGKEKRAEIAQKMYV